MNKAFYIFMLAASALFAIGCKSNKEAASATPTTQNTEQINTQTQPQMLASIERTACYGRCPVYKATFMDNGEVTYVGKHFVENIGTYKALISADDVQEIKNKITEYNYFALDSLYPTPITDFPSSITEVNYQGKLKKVINRRTPPANLKAFEQFLDSLLEGKEWEKISDNTRYTPINTK